MDILKAISAKQAEKFTENGCRALDSTSDDLLDLFAFGGALRSRPADILSMFSKAYYEDALLATKLMFYIRDIRGGLGERDAFRAMLNDLAINHTDVVLKNIDNIPFYGRWDDMIIALMDTPAENAMVRAVKKQLSADYSKVVHDRVGKKDNHVVSLLAKWMPSINTSSPITVKLAKKLCNRLNMTECGYRKTLATIRRYLNVVEVNMSSDNYADINYEQVPSKAMNLYRNAFARNDEYRFSQYMNKVNSGTAEIKAGTLYPYDIVEKILDGVSDKVLEAQWRALPNYVTGNQKFLVMADTSGSMYGRPLATAVGLAIYFAERNTGAYHNKFMTFSESPRLQEIKGSNLQEKVRNLARADWDMNTNLEKAFEVILDAAVENHATQNDLPTSLVIISDMEIDDCVNSADKRTFYETMKNRYEDAGYQLPNLVFWNVDSRQNTVLADKNAKNVQLVSGQSATTFMNLATGYTPVEFMVHVLNAPRYDRVTI